MPAPLVPGPSYHYIDGGNTSARGYRNLAITSAGCTVRRHAAPPSLWSWNV